MLGDISGAEHIYIACGRTDMRKSIDGLAAIVQQNFKLNPFSNSLLLFCGHRCDRIKALYWEGDFSIKDWKTEGSNGQEHRKMYERFLYRNTGGCSRVYPSTSPKQSKTSLRGIKALSIRMHTKDMKK